MVKPAVLSLFDFSGVMVAPWEAAGYPCFCLDIRHPPGVNRVGERLTLIGCDIAEFEPPDGWEWAIVFAFPPCTHLASSGARWFKRKGLWPTIGALTAVARTVDLVSRLNCPWMLENPKGLLNTFWRERDFEFDPCDFGGWVDPPADGYTKRTYLWAGGGFVMPAPRPVPATEGSRAHKCWSSQRDERERTPAGFARAVFMANGAQ